MEPSWTWLSSSRRHACLQLGFDEGSQWGIYSLQEGRRSGMKMWIRNRGKIRKYLQPYWPWTNVEPSYIWTFISVVETFIDLLQRPDLGGLHFQIMVDCTFLDCGLIKIDQSVKPNPALRFVWVKFRLNLRFERNFDLVWTQLKIKLNFVIFN